MNSLILRTATRFLLPLLLLFSVFLLLRGHNEPGGGFVGGLVAASAIGWYAITYDVKSALKVLRISPQTLIGLGLLMALLAGWEALLVNRPFLTGIWGDISFPTEEMHIGTPLVFDIGVYFVVLGVTLMVLLSLLEE